jgi:hypothetical protein
MVTVITLKPEQVTPKMAIFVGNTPTATIGIVAIVYTTNNAISETQLIQKLTTPTLQVLTVQGKSRKFGHKYLFNFRFELCSHPR